MDLKKHEDGSYTVGSLSLEPTPQTVPETEAMRANNDKWAEYWAKHDAELKQKGVDLNKSTLKEDLTVFHDWVATLPDGARVYHPLVKSKEEQIQDQLIQAPGGLKVIEPKEVDSGSWNYCPHCGFKLKNDPN